VCLGYRVEGKVFFSVSIWLAVHGSLRLELSLEELITELLKFVFELGIRPSCDSGEAAHEMFEVLIYWLEILHFSTH
jgi:hypothetical protein